MEPRRRRSVRTLYRLASIAFALAAAAVPQLASAQKASLAATPDRSAAAGSTIAVQWSGPNGKGDYVTITALGAKASDYLSYQNTAAGSPASIELPVEPGKYEIRYVLNEPKTVLASLPYEVLPVAAALEVPASGTVGATITIAWTGPNQPRDWITIVKPSAGAGEYSSYVDANSAGRTLNLPVAPGTYEVRYVQGGTKVLATAPIEVTDVKADVTGPRSVAPGDSFEIAWNGPNQRGDWITIVKPAAGATTFGSYVDATPGLSTATLRAPAEAGAYELRYVLRGQRVIAVRSIEVGAAADAAGSAAAPPATKVAVAPAARAFELDGFTAVGFAANVAPTVKPGPAINPRTFELDGFTAVGFAANVTPKVNPAPAINPRTFELDGWTGRGP